jgi:hypothetical protein
MEEFSKENLLCYMYEMPKTYIELELNPSKIYPRSKEE